MQKPVDLFRAFIFYEYPSNKSILIWLTKPVSLIIHRKNKAHISVMYKVMNFLKFLK